MQLTILSKSQFKRFISLNIFRDSINLKKSAFLQVFFRWKWFFVFQEATLFCNIINLIRVIFRTTKFAPRRLPFMVDEILMKLYNKGTKIVNNSFTERDFSHR